MKWTKDLPTSPGYYWFVNSLRKERTIEVIAIIGDKFQHWEKLYMKEFSSSPLLNLVYIKQYEQLITHTLQKQQLVNSPTKTR